MDHLEVSGPGGRELVALEHGRVVVGSSPECDLVLQDAAVSQAHAVLERVVSAVWTAESRFGVKQGVNGAERAVAGGPTATTARPPAARPA